MMALIFQKTTYVLTINAKRVEKTMKATQYKKKRVAVFAKRNKQVEERVIDLNLQHTKNVLALEAKFVERAANVAQYKKDRVAVFTKRSKGTGYTEKRIKPTLYQSTSDQNALEDRGYCATQESIRNQNHGIAEKESCEGGEDKENKP